MPWAHHRARKTGLRKRRMSTCCGNGDTGQLALCVALSGSPHTHTRTHSLGTLRQVCFRETRIGYSHATSWNISMSTHSNTGTAKENPQEGLRSLLPPCTFPHPFPNCLPPTPRSQPPGLCSSNKDAGDVDTISCGALGYISVPGPALDVVRCAAAPNVARHTSRRTLQPFTKSVRTRTYTARMGVPHLGSNKTLLIEEDK